MRSRTDALLKIVLLKSKDCFASHLRRKIAFVRPWMSEK